MNESTQNQRRRNAGWKRVHHSWIFWVAVFLMLFAMIGYVVTGDLFWGLPAQLTEPPSRASGK